MKKDESVKSENKMEVNFHEENGSEEKIKPDEVIKRRPGCKREKCFCAR
ncbi:hypothetical protein ACIPSR_07790 [Pectobacterium sp. CHL-2024]|nr:MULTISPECIES: hypothetical protein [Pectobacterium]MBA0209083.1 hypothetical protein [Pectobacterium brasiliense]MBE5214501.1 hypothetical protein [Pectobacterium quasiaquaticum]MBE5226466.1 hypothetical protein [Pectobacterium quasiaquaticum]URG52042.1 hypothetical protein IG605_015385 [Pectobacterium quasiaquaticum]WJM81723.1 hypothetical protein QTI90_02890 [Pectobacterium brasiliense]